MVDGNDSVASRHSGIVGDGLRRGKEKGGVEAGVALTVNGYLELWDGRDEQEREHEYDVARY